MPRCKKCKEKFETRFTTLEKYCWNPECKTVEALEKLSKQKKAAEKKQRQNLKERKKAIETVSQLANRVQKLVNEYVRHRDAGKPCISCNKILTGKFDAGHYYNMNNHWNLRYDLQNIWGQCVRCNRSLHGNLIEYRKKLVAQIGEKGLQRLDSECHVIRKFTKPELYEIMDEFKMKLKEIKSY